MAACLGKNSPNNKKINVVKHSAIIIDAISDKSVSWAIVEPVSTAQTPAKIPVKVIPTCATVKGAGDSVIAKTAAASESPSSDNFSSRPR